jgi:SET and MYND domain-containing protein
MQVVAIRLISPGEEVVTSYVDLALPKKSRKEELKERYKFECGCEECEREGADPREALECSKTNCAGLLNIVGKQFS